MIVKVNKKWWQFWVPRSIDIAIVMAPTSTTEPVNAPFFIPEEELTGAEAIEANEAEPWYGGEADDNESSVVTAEPPIVYASRGNAIKAEREQHAKM